MKKAFVKLDSGRFISVDSILYVRASVTEPDKLHVNNLRDLEIGTISRKRFERAADLVE